ncbi:MAG: hypothetical protein KF716_33880 [Anaerolineae bacterium]|nr:hypothetical protein [Anaerolineae bacterium]
MAVTQQQLTDFLRHEQARLHLEATRRQTLNPVPLVDELASLPAVQRSNHPVMVVSALASIQLDESNQFTTTVAVINATDERAENALVELRWIGVNGAGYEEQQQYVTLEPNTMTEVTTLSRPLTDVDAVSILDLTLWTFLSFLPISNRYVLMHGNPSDVLRASPTTTLEIRRNDSAGFVTLTNTGTAAALGLHLSAEAVQFEDDIFSLLPAETRSISLTSDHDQPSARIRVEGWNIASISV